MFLLLLALQAAPAQKDSIPAADSIPRISLGEAIQRSARLDPDYVQAVGQIENAEWGRRAATSYMYTYPMMEPQPFAVRMQEEMIAEIERDPGGHERAAAEIADSCFSHEVVLGDLLRAVGMPGRGSRALIPLNVDLMPRSRRPLTRPATASSSRATPISIRPDTRL